MLHIYERERESQLINLHFVSESGFLGHEAMIICINRTSYQMDTQDSVDVRLIVLIM